MYDKTNKTIFIYLILTIALSYLTSNYLAYKNEAYGQQHGCPDDKYALNYTNSSSVCLTPYELETACTVGGSLEGNALCSDIIGNNSRYFNGASTLQLPLESSQSTSGEQEVLLEDEGSIPEQEQIIEGTGPEREVITEGGGRTTEQEVITEGHGPVQEAITER